MTRGEVWWADLPAPVGSGPGFRRPVLVVSADMYNQSRISTVVVVIITSNMRLAKAPGNVFLSSGESGLPQDSVVNITQLATLDKHSLDTRISVLPSTLTDEVSKGLRQALAL